MKPALVILAAGLGSRYGGLKQLDTFGPSGESIIHYTVYDAVKAGFGKTVFVIRKENLRDFEKVISDKIKHLTQIEFAFQDTHQVPEKFAGSIKRTKPWGTGHALLAAEKSISEPFLSVNADDYYGKDAFISAFEFLKNSDNNSSKFCSIGYRLGNALSDYGSVARAIISVENGYLKTIREIKNIGKCSDGACFLNEKNEMEFLSADCPVSMNMWGFTPKVFEMANESFGKFLEKNAASEKTEFLLPDFVASVASTQKASISVIPTSSEWFGVTYAEDKKDVVQKLAAMHKRKEYPVPL
ncbi:MAG: hypothetical protein A2W91_02000 [Bacteroidetes bacterium GWF2_38_335]|nr:MAG: hypothetical protein A2W91_02000 [Bacteroidetes bacterium GWF2_38_335]OFY80626.1 MAG: hypothetical protein A2281_05015 [Bacteroidetes bacterium RIFOXYA12_FULL_38_20]HBS86966.1 hypothetical protein [Bacteroidales bacterium]